MFGWSFNKQRLGELLVELGHITELQLEHALREPRRYGERLGATLMRLGFIDRRQLALALMRQYGRALLGAVGLMAMTLHPELAVAAMARAQLGVSASVVGTAVTDLRPVGVVADGAGMPKKVAVTLACTVLGDARIGVEGGRLAARAATLDYVRTWQSAVRKTLACGASPRSVKVAVASQHGGDAGWGAMRAVNVTIDY